MNNWMPDKNIFFPQDTDYKLAQVIFDNWYEQSIIPLFNNAVKVRLDSRLHDVIREDANWSQDFLDRFPNNGLLIKIEPRKKETAEDLLFAIVKDSLNSSDDKHTYVLKYLIEKAKAFLEQKK